MKRIGLLLVMVLASYAAMLSCKEDKSKVDLVKLKYLLVSEWKLTEWNLLPEMMISDSVKAVMMKNAKMEFTEDNKFIFTGLSSVPLTGTYKLWESGKTLTLKPDNGGESYNHSILELTDVKLSLLDPNGNNLICTH